MYRVAFRKSSPAELYFRRMGGSEIMNYSKQNPFDMDSRFKSDYELLSRNFDNRVERMGSDGVVSCAIYGLRGLGQE